MKGVEAARLGQAIDRFKERTKGEELPEALPEALTQVEGLLKQEARSEPTPGERAAGKTRESIGRAPTKPAQS